MEEIDRTRYSQVGQVRTFGGPRSTLPTRRTRSDAKLWRSMQRCATAAVFKYSLYLTPSIVEEIPGAYFG
jgi:hypothetical protein